MPPTTRGQEAFEQYLKSEEVKENKLKIQAAVDADHTLDIFQYRIRVAQDDRGRNVWLIYMATGSLDVLKLGIFRDPQQRDEARDVYEQALCDALNGRIVIEEVDCS